MISLSLTYLVVALQALTSTLAVPAPTDPLQAFEQRYLDQQQWQHPNSSVKLIGFVRIWMPDESREAMARAVQEFPWQWDHLARSGHYWDAEKREHRRYFPVADAMVWHGRSLIEANEMGEFERDVIDGDMHVLGRRQTEHIHGVDHNVIRDGIVMLHTPRKPVRSYGNVHVYDFGEREPHDHEHDHDEEAGDSKKRDLKKRTAKCYSNHGNKICTFLPRVGFHGRCARPARSQQKCVDYNGWIPKCGCINGCGKFNPNKYIGFPGSDCDYALGAGQCWNEVM